MKENEYKVEKEMDCKGIINLLSVLSNEKRISIVCLLKNNKMNVSEIARELNMPQSSVSINLEKLFSKGIVSKRRSGKFVYYKLKVETVKTIVRKLTKLLLK